MKKTSLALSISLILGSQTATANPSGPQVIRGSATFSNPSANVLNVTNSHNAIINWQSFNIGQGQTTNFHQPSAASSVLNRVISNSPSQLLGNLNSNGKVFLINQHGILVGADARINTGGFFGSTLNITDSDFLNGRLKFEGGGAGDIENLGYIHAMDDGNVVLIAPNIENGGVISTDNGNVILAAGESITISSLENPAMQFAVTAEDNSVTNLGSIIANRGAATLFAGTLRHSGSIQATGLVRDADGTIRLVAQGSNNVSGSLDASSDRDGGRIEVLGDVIQIESGADIDASGGSVAGEILIGGDQQGLNPAVMNATSTTIDKGATVSADGIGSGDGGRVIVFAENDVHVHGEVTARGGDISGDGGFIETSGLRVLDITAIPDAGAANGEAGEWLIDPYDISIVAAGTNDPADPDGIGPLNEYSSPFTSSVDATTLSVGIIETALSNGTDVTITTGAGGTGLGDISLDTPMAVSTFGSVGDLTLNADNDININSTFDFDGYGGGAIVAFNAGNDININSDVTLDDGLASGPSTFNLSADNNVNIDADISASYWNMTATADFDGDSNGDLNVAANIASSAFGGLDLDFSAGGNITLDGTVPITIDVFDSSTITLTAPQSFVIGDVTIGAGYNDQIDLILNTQLEISGNLNLGIDAAEHFVFSTGPIDITPTGSMSINSFCGDGCGLIRFNNNVTNNGLVEMILGGVSIEGNFLNNGTISNNSSASGDSNSGRITVGNSGPGVFDVGPGSQIINPGSDERELVIGPTGQFNVDNPLVLPQVTTLRVNEGAITNAQNLSLPDNIIFQGATVEGQGIWQIPDTAWARIEGTINSDITFKGLPGDPLIIENYGSIDWFGGFSAPSDNINLLDAEIRNYRQFYASTLTATMTGTNGSFKNDTGALFGLGLGATINIDANVAFDSLGTISIGGGDILNLAGDLTLRNGALLMGEGTLNLNSGNGRLFVENGGGIAPGMNDDGTLTIQGNLTIDNGANLLFDIKGDLINDRINVAPATYLPNTVDFRGGEVFLLWEGAGFTTLSSGASFTFISCFDVIGNCMTDAASVALLNINEPLNTTGSSLIQFQGTSEEELQFQLGTKTGTVVTWDGGGGDQNWSNALNWSTDVVPTLADSVIIDDALGSILQVDITEASAAGSLQSDALLILNTAGSSLTLDDNAYLTQTYTREIGLPDPITPNFTGLIVDSADGSLLDGGSGTSKLYTLAGTYNDYHRGSTITLGEWNNDGLLCLEDNVVMELDGTTFTNHGVFRFMQTDSATVDLIGGGQLFNDGIMVVNPNASTVNLDLTTNGPDGTIIQTTGSLVFTSDFDNFGLIDIQNGDATLQATANIGLDGEIKLADATRLTVDTGGTFVNGVSSFGLTNTGAGHGQLVVQNGGVFDFDGGPNNDLSGLQFINVNNGSLLNVQGATLADTLNLSNAILIGNDAFDLASTSTVTVNGTSVFELPGFTVTNNGLINVLAGSTLSLADTSLSNAAGSSLSGAGQLLLPAATSFASGGTVDIARINLAGGTLTANSLNYAGDLLWVDGIVNGTGIGLTTSGASTLTTGTLNTDWTIGAGGSLAMTTGPLGGSGRLILPAGSIFTPAGTVTIPNIDLVGGGLLANGFSYAGDLLWNGGTIGGSGLTTSGATTGLLGTLNTDWTIASGGSLAMTTGGALDGTGRLNLPTGASFTPDGAVTVPNIDLTGGTLTANGLSYAGDLLWNGGTIAGTGLTTSGTTNVISGDLNTDWTLTSGGSANVQGNVIFFGGGITIENGANLTIDNGSSLILGSLFTGIGIDGSLLVDNGGTLDLDTGFADLSGTGALNVNGGTVTNVQGAVLPTTVNLGNSGTIKGVGSLEIPAATTLTAGDGFLGGVFGVGNLSINNLGTIDVLATNTLVLSDADLTIDAATGSLTGAGQFQIPFSAQLIADGTVDIQRLELGGGTLTANNLVYAGDLVWASGTVDGTGLTTSGQVDLNSGILNTDWLITATGTVDWTGTDTDELVINNATITNQGRFSVNSFVNTTQIRTAGKNFATSTGAAFINEGLLVINADAFPTLGDSDTVVFDLNFTNDGGTIAIQSGTFRIEDAGVAQDLVLDQAGESLQGFGTFDGNVVNITGTVTPGRADPANSIFQTGTLTITGDFIQRTQGTLVIKLDSTVVNNSPALLNDTLVVGGELNAGGEVRFEVVNGKSPTDLALLLDQSFVPFSFGSFAGRFDSVDIPQGLNFSLGPGGVITITSDNPVLNQISNQLEVLFENEDLNHRETVRAMKFIDRQVELFYDTDEDDDERKRAPRLVCK
ncbi:MAG: filamentous hemagglutinin N-terminal domain-containing protein [Gammaproteobacteria bacterium]|nr:filamentous hemagglutinin N-terminal domain-containing protein [Gammaproteobacteria bacterium]